ncbi:MAG: flagellar basal-body MS-ring/collar protein FliF [Opitutaceae bacterium]|jgi:flagellar M-ring protein FliF
MKPFAQSILALWGQLGLNQRVSLVVATLVVAGLVTGLVLWSHQPDYQLLYGRLAEKDAAAIVTSLQAQGVKHRVSQGGGTIYVPADQVHRLRMELAGKGLPGGEGVGFEIFDKGQFGLSDFVQRTNYNRAIQGELARTISQLDGVSGARVMIVQPENRLLLTEQGIKPTASVFIEVNGRLETEAVNSIRHLVANSVQGLSPDAVAVVDQRGRVLSAELKEDPLLGSASSLIRYRQQVEDYFARKIEGMLAPVLGTGQAIVRVSAEIDNESATLTEEKFDPDSSVIRSQTNTDDTTTTTEARKGGVTGVAGNTPGAPAPAEAERANVTNAQNRKNATISYEINRTTSNVKRNPGGIKSLTAAVFVATRTPAADQPAVPRTPAELDGLRRIVINALGLKAAAGQSLDELVSLQETPFQPVAADERIQRLTTETRVQGWVETGSRYLAVAIALGAFFVFFRMLRRQRPEPVPVELLAMAAAHGSGRSNGHQATLTPDLLNELIRQKPANVGTALRDWVSPKRN